jgi:hypothetical protein
VSLAVFALLLSTLWALVGVIEAVIAEEPMNYADAVETVVLVVCVAALWTLR